MPKPIVHGHGGIMWNLLMNTLTSGATILHYDGNPAWPDMGALRQFVDRGQATFFGASAAYIAQCMKAEVHPREQMSPAGIARLRTIGSTGSPLPIEGY